MTNPRDPEGLMPDAEEAGPPVGPEGDLPGDGATVDGGALDTTLDRSALAGRTDTDELGSDPDVRFPGASEDPVMTSPDHEASDGGASQTDRDPLG